MFSLTNGTRQKAPRVPFLNYAEKVLGSTYSLSVVLVGDQKMRTLNRIYRKKDATTDILSFPLDKKNGEIFINVNAASKKAKTFDLKPLEYLNYMFIHGLLHLKGHTHGRTMERLEDAWVKRLGLKGPKR